MGRMWERMLARAFVFPSGREGADSQENPVSSASIALMRWLQLFGRNDAPPRSTGSRSVLLSPVVPLATSDVP
jgi:hypothetical protein